MSNSPCANCISSFTGSCSNYCAYYAQNKTADWITQNRELQQDLWERTKRDWEMREQTANSYPSDEEILARYEKKKNTQSTKTELEVENLENSLNEYIYKDNCNNSKIDKLVKNINDLESRINYFENLSLLKFIWFKIKKYWKDNFE